MTSTSTRQRPGDGNVVAFPGTMSRYVLRGGDEFKWHCPFHDCYESGRYVKRFRTAVRGLERHVGRCHGV